MSQSLAGRTSVLHLLPFTRSEIIRFKRYPKTLDETLLYGGYPLIFDRKLDPSEWLQSYVATHLERDVRTISNVGDLATFRRFVELCAVRTSQRIDYSSLAGDCGISQPTAKAWLSILETSFIAFRLNASFAATYRSTDVASSRRPASKDELERKSMRGQINRADRLQRLVTATLLIGLNAIGLSESSEWTRWRALVVQIELLATGLAGWCPFYWSFRLSQRS